MLQEEVTPQGTFHYPKQLQNALTRLEQRFTPEGKIEKRTDDIIALINSSPTEANLIEKFQYDDDRPKPKKEEEAQDYLIAYLYSKIRSEFVIQKREYDPKKERLNTRFLMRLRWLKKSGIIIL